jgi:hypothetical protein
MSHGDPTRPEHLTGCSEPESVAMTARIADRARARRRRSIRAHDPSSAGFAIPWTQPDRDPIRPPNPTDLQKLLDPARLSGPRSLRARENSWRSRTISRPGSRGSWRENRVSRRSSSAEVLALASLPVRKLNLSRMRGRESPALPSRAGNETPSRSSTVAARFERRASNLLPT